MENDKEKQKLFKKYQEKSTTFVDDYECKLSPELQQILKDELRETPELRSFALKKLRDWTLQNPGIIKSRLDSIWLLKYLRLKKYNIPAVQECIERHLVLRHGEFYYSNFHYDLDIKRPCIQRLLNLGIVCMLERRDAEKRPIIIVRDNQLPSEGDCLGKDIITILSCLTEFLNEIEEFQIRGVVYVWDLQSFNARHLKLFTLDRIYKLVKNCEAITAGRHKGFHFVNLHPIVAIPMKFAFDTASSKKFGERLNIYRSFDEFKLVDKKYLPKEYGGEKPFIELANHFNSLLKANSEHMINYLEMKVNPAMYPKAVLDGEVEMLKIPLNSPDLFKKVQENEIFGVQGSFRKLEID